MTARLRVLWNGMAQPVDPMLAAAQSQAAAAWAAVGEAHEQLIALWAAAGASTLVAVLALYFSGQESRQARKSRKRRSKALVLQAIERASAIRENAGTIQSFVSPAAVNSWARDVAAAVSFLDAALAEGDEDFNGHIAKVRRAVDWVGSSAANAAGATPATVMEWLDGPGTILAAARFQLERMRV
jgi:hypothetical protein